MSLNNQNNLVITSEYKTLRSQDDLRYDATLGQCIILSPTDGQTDFQVSGLYEWAYTREESWFRVEVSTASDFATTEQIADVQAKQLASTIPVGTNYYIRISALRVVNPANSEVTGVSLLQSTTEVPEGGDRSIEGTVQGNGDYDTVGIWTRESGDAISFTVSGNTITISGVTETDSAVFRFKSRGDESIFVDRTITVVASSSEPALNNSRAGDEESLRLHAESLGVANWNSNTGWSAMSMSLDDPIEGVTVATIGGELRVTAIDIIDNNCIGQLPEFPGLQEMNAYYVNQSSVPGTTSALNTTDYITGPLPDSLGHTKVTELGLASRPRNKRYLKQENYQSVQKKSGRPRNQYTGVIPDSYYNLELEYLDLDGQDYLDCSLKSGCGNWTIKMIKMGGSVWYYDQNYQEPLKGSATFGFLPSAIKNWVDCEIFEMQDHPFGGIAIDAFEGWNDIEGRYIDLTFDANAFRTNNVGRWNQDVPTVTHLTKTKKMQFGGRNVGGDFPTLSIFTEMEEFGMTGDFTDSQDIITEACRNQPMRRIGIGGEGDGLTGNLFQPDMYLGGFWGNRVILITIKQNSNSGGSLNDGMHEWYRVRYAWLNDMNLSGPLPDKPPALHSPSLRMFRLSNNNFIGPIPAGWGEIGSRHKFGGSLLSADGAVTDSGEITSMGEDATGNYIEDSSQSWGVNEFQPETETANGPRVKLGTTANDTKRVISNTATRIYFEGENPKSIGDSFDVVNCLEVDERDFNVGLSLNNNGLSGIVDESLALKNATSGATLDIGMNRFTIKDLIDSVSAIETMASQNGWTYIYAPQKPFGSFQTITLDSSASETHTIDYSNEHVAGNTYQWFRDGNEIAGETASSITVSMAGDYRLQIKNPALPDFDNGDELESETTRINVE